MAGKSSKEELEQKIKQLEQETAARKAGQEKIERLNLVLRAIRNVNQLLVKEKDPIRLLRGICDNLVENRGYFNAWIALLDESGRLTCVAEAGLGAEFFPLTERMRKGELTRCVRNILSQPLPQIIEDPASTCTDCPLSKSYTGRGGITARLDYGGKTYGVLSASIPKHFVTDPEEQNLFAEISGDIAFALHQIELEKQYEETHEALRVASTYAAENPYPVFRVASDGTIVYANEGSRRVLEKWGRHSGEEVPNDWLDILHGVLASGVKQEIEMEVDDNIFSFTIVQVEGTNYVNIYGLDITKHRITEKALKNSERRFRDLVENSLVGIGIVQDGEVVYRNPEQERLWGPVSQKATVSSFEYVHEDDADKVKAMLQKVMTGEMAQADMEFRVRPPETAGRGHELRWVHCRVSLTKYHEKEALLINMVDITDAKELESLLRIEDKMASLGRVAAGIAHEIRNPLSGINIYLDTLEKVYDKAGSYEKVPGILERLKSASNKIESVVRRVMDFAKPSAPSFVWSNINEPIEEAINLASVALRKRGIRVEKNLSEKLPLCRIDPQMLEGVILNLITNAAEAMQEIEGDRRIELTSSLAVDSILVAVSDSGPGVHSGFRDKIFDPFYSTKNGSTGIGLSLSQRIIVDHGAFLGVFESRWGGAEFVIEIPIGQGIEQR